MRRVGLVKSIVTGGRKFGASFILGSQRPAELHKTPLSQCWIRLFGKTTERLDREAVEDYLTFNDVGYKIFKDGLVRRFNPTLFAVRKEDKKGWFLVELRDGQWTCDCDAVDASGTLGSCPHVYAALLSSATHRAELEESSEVAEERPIRCRYCGSPDISKVGFRYNARGISRRYLCNECRRKFSVAYVEPQAVVGLPSGALWLLSQIAMITAKLNDLLRDLDERIASEQTDNKLPQAGSDSSIRT